MSPIALMRARLSSPGFGVTVALTTLLALVACDGTLEPVRGQQSSPRGPLLAQPVEPGVVSNVDVTFTVRTDQDLVYISPRIYGICSNSKYGLSYVSSLRWSAYNWENNASNAGVSYHYQNDAEVSASDVPGQGVRTQLDEAQRQSSSLALSLSILDYVAADKAADGDVRNSGANYLTTRFKQNLPKNPKGATNEPTTADAFVYQDDYVTWVRGAYSGTDVCFLLDSTPDLRSKFHPELHPKPVGYQELVKRTLDYATAVKDAWPEAPVVGLGSYGWTGWETLEDSVTHKQPPDAAGNGQFLDYWLDQLHQADQVSGRRVVDMVDLRWYSEAQGGGVRVIGTATTPAVVEARLQAPRSLWDPTYVESSWIVNVHTKGAAIQWLPTTMTRIKKHYPGTQLAVGQWNFGGDEHISGALATADALGIFGRYGVAMAAHTETKGAFALAAFDAYRNFDGKGAHFGDTSIAAVTSFSGVRS